jgi:hypothetical protein
MKTILRNKQTGFYFQGVADWTTKVADAFDFRCPERVVKFVLAARLNIEQMEVVLAFEDGRYNIPLPLDERFGLTRVARGKAARADSAAPQPWTALAEALCGAPKDALDPGMFPGALG